MDLQLRAPKGIPKSKSLATYEQWREHERQMKRSQSEAELALAKQNNEDQMLLMNNLEEHHSRVRMRQHSNASSTSGDSGMGYITKPTGLRNGPYTPNKGKGPPLSRSGSRRSSAQNSSAAPLLDENGMLEYATLELRVHPPSVKIDNTLEEGSTVVIVDSANRPGTLVEVVERLTELGLGVRNAQISSDGGWFVDVFHVTNIEGDKVTDARTLERIENILELNFDISPGVPSAGKFGGMNVIEMVLMDDPGLLSRVSAAITRCQLNIYDTLLWAHKGYAAVLLTASESGEPVRSDGDLEALTRRLEREVGMEKEAEGGGDVGACSIQVDCCFDAVYVEKRFYRLKMRAMGAIEAAAGGGVSGGGGDEEAALVSSRFDHQTRYTTLHVRARDRNQLLFDTVCTLSDLGVDVFHATIDADGETANLEFFVKSSSGLEIKSEKEMKYVRERLGVATQLGAPAGALCLQVAGDDRKGELSRTTSILHEAGFHIQYCTSRTDPVSSKTCSVFYVGRAEDGGGVEYCEYVKQCCKRIGAKCVSLKGREEGGAGEDGEQDEGGGSGGGAGGGEVYTLETALLSSWNRLWLGRE